MSVAGAFRVWFGASVLSLAGVGLAAAWRILGVLPEFGFTAFTVAAALLLTFVAFVIGGKSRQFNLTVAAETLVALGVLSLVVGLGCAILLALSRFRATNTIGIADLSAVTTVFIEGLFTAAVCPMLAMFIRIRDAQLRVVEAGGAEMDAAARAADALTSQLKAMTATLTALNTALVEEVKTFRTAAAEVGAAARVMADDLFKGSKQAKEALQQVESGAASLGGSAEKAAAVTGRLGAELGGLTKSAVDTKALLDALSKAVESVERFIKGSGFHMTASLDRSQLQMQMGQEVIYLLLTSSMLGCIILAAYLLLHMPSVSALKREIADLNAALAAADKTSKGANRRTPPVLDKPPIIILRETDGFYFEQGSAEIGGVFEQRIHTEIIPQIVSLARAYQATVIEVIGHTDGVPVGPNLRVKANLDFTIAAFVEGKQSEAPIPFDNAGLGMARAVTMAKMLRANGLGEGFEILPLSAGSLISPADRYLPSDVKDNDATRRRIEIRLRRRHG